MLLYICHHLQYLAQNTGSDVATFESIRSVNHSPSFLLTHPNGNGVTIYAAYLITTLRTLT